MFQRFVVLYNYLRKHGSLEYTPAEAAGVLIRGMNKIITLIGNAGAAPQWEERQHKSERTCRVNRVVQTLQSNGGGILGRLCCHICGNDKSPCVTNT